MDDLLGGANLGLRTVPFPVDEVKSESPGGHPAKDEGVPNHDANNVSVGVMRRV